jgi:hypothetical protein
LFLRLDQRLLLDDLCAHFQRAGFTAEPAGGSMIQVTRPDAPSADQERREIELHARVWSARNSGAAVYVVS